MSIDAEASRPSTSQISSKTGGELIVDRLLANGIDTVFCLSGESSLGVLDALYDSDVRVVTTRHEGAAAYAAEAYGKLTGRPGVCLVNRGPGAAQAAIGVHAARQDSTPLLLLVGQVARAELGREAFQEVDHELVFRDLAKWTGTPSSADRIPELLDRALGAAVSGRPGPAVLALPEDVLTERATPRSPTAVRPAAAEPSPGQIAGLRDRLASARRPLLVVSEGGGWTATAGRDLRAFAEANHLPVVASFRCQDYVDNRSPSYVGHLGLGVDPELGARLRDADLLVVVGARLTDPMTKGYTLLTPPRTPGTLVHVSPCPDEIGRVFEADLGIVSSSPAFAAAVRDIELIESPWHEWTSSARTDYEALLRPPATTATVDMAEVVAEMRRQLRLDAIVTSGAGNFSMWLHRFFPLAQYGTQLAPRVGAMGYSLPAAIAAQLVHPDRTVVCFAGDGDFLMAGQELATIARYDLPIVVVVVNNQSFGGIRMHQEARYPGRVIGTDLTNPDFATYAEAFGLRAETVERTADFAGALQRALQDRAAALIELRTDVRYITPARTLDPVAGGLK